MLIQIYQRTLAKPKLASSPLFTVMELILKIVNCVYEQKSKQPCPSPHEMLYYRNDINQVYNSKRQITSMITSEPGGAPNPADIKVSSVVELKETFEILLDTINKPN